MAEVVITGMGAVSPHGPSVEALWAGLIAGKSAFSPLTLFDASMFRNPLAGVVQGYPVPGPDHPGKPARALAMLLDAATEALRDGLGVPASDTASDPRTLADSIRAGPLRGAAIVTGSNFGGMSAAEGALVGGAADVSKASLDGYLFGAASTELKSKLGLEGPQFNLSLACASGAAAIGLGLDLIRLGRAEVVLCAGYDELSLFIYAGLSALRAITTETIRPFDKRRKGTLFSEGAGAVLLESAEHARARKAPHLHARVLGRFMNNDAHHMTAPEENAIGIQAVMRGALDDAGVAPESIDHLNLHATGTPYNDAIETRAVLAVFGERGKSIPVASVKSSIGHTMGAAGVLETIAAVKTLQEQLAPTVLGLDPAQQDPACALHAPTAPCPGSYHTILKTSYGFGGTNAAVVLQRAASL
jgi:3-oxoacyl-[acyl-carrier-protein] synthase II